MFFISVIVDAFYHPISSIYILISLWIGIKIFHGYWNIESFAISYQDCIFKNQLWRLATTSFSHASILHLIYDIIMIWSCRSLENIYGYFFYLRYTILLLLFEPAITLALIYLFGRINAAAANANNVNLILPSPSLQGSLMVDQRNNPFFTTKFSGSSGVFLAWLTFVSIDSLTNPMYDKDEFNTYYLFGFFPISWVFAPILIALLLPMITNHNNAVANITGLTTGYLFVFGFLQILPDIYWTICFAVNSVLWILSHTVNSSAVPTTTTTTTTSSTINNSANNVSYSSQSTTASTTSNNTNPTNETNWFTPARSLFNVTDEVYHVPCFNQYVPLPPAPFSTLDNDDDDDDDDIELNRITRVGSLRVRNNRRNNTTTSSSSSSSSGRYIGINNDEEDDSLLFDDNENSHPNHHNNNLSRGNSGGEEINKSKRKNDISSSSSSSSSSFTAPSASALLRKMPLSTLLGINKTSSGSSSGFGGSGGSSQPLQQYTGLPLQDMSEYIDDDDDDGEEKKHDK